jgi:glycosyltransferase involved in cell wall biosynthesis
VAFPGPVSGTTKVSLFQWADLFVLPTHEENWGIVLFEALAAGTPVVTTRGVDVWQELEQTGAATVIGAGPGELTTTMRRLLLDRGELRQVGAAARTKVLQQHSLEQAVGRYIDLYRDLARDTTA